MGQAQAAAFKRYPSALFDIVSCACFADLLAA